MHAKSRLGHPDPSRRDFLKNSVATVGGGLATQLDVAQNAFAGGNDLLKIGLIGCGGRGTGAAVNALNADPNVKLVALGDVFRHRLDSSLAFLNKDKDIAGKVDVKEERCFVGFDAYQKVIDSGVDVVLLCTPPHFRPAHFKAAVAAGKHVFAEKPVAVDAPGVRTVMAACEDAQKTKLSIVSGLCLRYDAGYRETIQRIHDGAIGDIVALQTNNLLSGGNPARPREAGWSDMEWQLRNWLKFTWLSGDNIVEYQVHYLDICAWLMKGAYPVAAVGLGGRQVRTGAEWGNIFDHHSVVFEYANGAKMFSALRGQTGCHNQVDQHVVGTKGTSVVSERRLSIDAGDASWRYRDTPKRIHVQVEHDELFASIRAGKPINNGEYMTKSTLMAIMGRMATYTGQRITWQMALDSKEDLSPSKYDWGNLAVPTVAVPGQTRYF